MTYVKKKQEELERIFNCLDATQNELSNLTTHHAEYTKLHRRHTIALGLVQAIRVILAAIKGALTSPFRERVGDMGNRTLFSCNLCECHAVAFTLEGDPRCPYHLLGSSPQEICPVCGKEK